ncbi:hypothetical protein GJ633_05545 [Halorubrum sp. CBA1125]|uniref:hypothetical protein n=1 Tax=Halorubrum sp. CBA1125 TaxID=2668072 RepID=UPI0012E7477A|nr:hypothetical protein [Halorubrum sp. CBA1125]MUW14179.1 hypothetical protein [Halorubrum sp. CBA1125]
MDDSTRSASSSAVNEDAAAESEDTADENDESSGLLSRAKTAVSETVGIVVDGVLDAL